MHAIHLENTPLNELNVLAVDDEVFNLEILTEWLTDWGVTVDAVENAEHALSLLDAGERPYHILLVDRMMPVMDGFKFLAEVKQRPKWKDIPVVMQSASATVDEIQSAFARGVWYYLCKPFERRKLYSLIEAAIRDTIIHNQLRQDVKEFSSLPSPEVTEIPFQELRSLEEVRQAALKLSRLSVAPEKVVVGLYELLVNAIEHGNLEIGYSEKTRLLNDHLWEEEIATRLNKSPYCDRKASISVAMNGNELEYRIKDQGNGFRSNSYLQFQTHRAGDNHGRGIAIASKFSFTRLQYLGRGNEVLAVSQPVAEKAA